MNTHHKNIKQISNDMQKWMHSNLSHLGVYECCYHLYDMQKQQWMSMPVMYDWYCRYLEKGFDITIQDRFNLGWSKWNEQDILYRQYKSYLKKKNIAAGCKLDFISPTTNGLEALTLGVSKSVSMNEHIYIQQKFYQLSKAAQNVILEKPQVMLGYPNNFKW